MSEDYTTPAMRQYMKTKAENPDCLLLFRMGDFYETFFDDAKAASKTLGITLTKRGIKGGSSIPLAGIPYHALDNYLGKLVRAGIKVGIVEQLEDPKLAKGVVKRGLIRIVTAGTLTESDLLDTSSNNYIVSLMPSKDGIGLTAADISTGEMLTTLLTEDKLIDELTRLSPAEIILPESYIGKVELPGYLVQKYPDWHFHLASAEAVVQSQYGLGSLGIEHDSSIASCGALLSYLKDNHQSSLQHMKRPRVYSSREYMMLDKTTIRNLELIQNVRGGKDGTLLSVLDSTSTPMGARLLKRWLLNPLIDQKSIVRRLEAVQELKDELLTRSDLSECLRRIGDIERAMSRISCGLGGQKELLSLKLSLSQVPKLRDTLKRCNSALLKELSDMPDTSAIHKLIESAIDDSQDRIIMHGYNAELDALRDIMRSGHSMIASMQETERTATGIKSLRISYNKVFGYYIEVTKANLRQVPSHYIRKQTTALGERFYTEGLKELEEKISGAEDRSLLLQNELLKEVLLQVTKNTTEALSTANSIAICDVLLSFAEAAASNRYIKPSVDDRYRILLRESRHPVIEQTARTFIPNDLLMDNDSRFHIITGPNMAGKSTFMRQAALISLMAQIGSFVPAKEAELGIVDRIFTRVGAHDDLVHGQSTFMVEMSEVSAIISNATDRSLIIMDEIGRGTSTYDGLAIAWSVALHINQIIKAKTLFATHYHALSQLQKHEGISNYHAAVSDTEGKIVFLRKMLKGGTDKSYGIHVATLAGMPPEVIRKAEEIQFILEDEDRTKKLLYLDRKQKGNVTVLSKGHQKTLSDL